MTSSSVADIEAVLSALRSVPGVRSADIGADDDGSPGVLKLDLEDGVDEVEVASAVGKLLRERFGLGVDAGEVQMVEAMSDFVAAPRSAHPSEQDVHVVGMSVTSTGRKVNVTVRLRRGDQHCAGEAAGTASPSGVLRAVADAALHAIEELTEDAVIGRVEHLDVADGIASVALLLDVDGTEVPASAVSPVQADGRQAVVRAVLTAVASHLPG